MLLTLQGGKDFPPLNSNGEIIMCHEWLEAAGISHPFFFGRSAHSKDGMFDFIAETAAGNFAILVPKKLEKGIGLARFMHNKLRDVLDRLRRESEVPLDKEALLAEAVRVLTSMDEDEQDDPMDEEDEDGGEWAVCFCSAIELYTRWSPTHFGAIPGDLMAWAPGHIV